MKKLATLAALTAALTFTSTAHAVEQSQAVPGVGTVTVSEPHLMMAFSPFVYVTISAEGNTSSADFSPIVLLEGYSGYVLRADGNGTGVATSVRRGPVGTPGCQWIGAPSGTDASSFVTTSVSADGRTITFAIPRDQLPGVPPQFRWMAVDGGAEIDCDPNPPAPGVPSTEPGVRRDVSTDPAAMDFAGHFMPVEPDRPGRARVTAKPLLGGVELSWPPVPNAVTYSSGIKGEKEHDLSFDDATSRTIRGLQPGRTYSAAVTAENHLAGTNMYFPGPRVWVEFVPKARADSDGDGIANEWKAGGKPARPRTAKVTAKAVTLTLPEAPRGAKLRVYRKSGDNAYKVVATTAKRTVKVGGAKPSTTYRFKVVAVNAKGKQSAASKAITVKTR